MENQVIFDPGNIINSTSSYDSTEGEGEGEGEGEDGDRLYESDCNNV